MRRWNSTILRTLLLCLPLGLAAAFAAALGAPTAALAQAVELGEGASGVDLNVLYIERTPKYERYAVEYADGKPALVGGSETAQRWPQTGEIVTFHAHVMNKGTVRSSAFQVTWYIDGVQVHEEAGPPLWPDEEHVFTYQWPWAHRLDGERLLDAHSVRVVVDADDVVPETFETNNTLEDRTDALGLVISVAPDVYWALDHEPQPGAAYSAEDWLQRHVLALNAALAAARYESTPDGVAVRVRIDKIRIAWSRPPVEPGYDGGWFVDADYRTTSVHYDEAADIDWGMVHEWGHQLGLIDTYRFTVHADTVDVVRGDGRAWVDSYDFPGAGLMENALSGDLGEYTAAALHSTAGYRRGHYGEFQYDLAPQITLEVRDRQGCAVGDAAVSFYQRDPRVDQDEAARRIDNTPEWEGVTGADGRLPLPNRPIAAQPGGAAATATGHVLRDNPFGVIDIVGTGNIGVLKLQKDDREQYAWLTAPDLNLAFWRAGRPAAQTYTIFWEGESGADCPVGGTIGGVTAHVYLPFAAQ